MERKDQIPLEEFKQMAEYSPNIIWVWNAEGEVVYINKRWFEYSQTNSDHESRESRWSEVLHPDDLSFVKSGCKKGIETGKETMRMRTANRL